MATIMDQAPDAVKSMHFANRLWNSGAMLMRWKCGSVNRVTPRWGSSKDRFRCKSELSTMAAGARRARARGPATKARAKGRTRARTRAVTAARARNVTVGTVVNKRADCRTRLAQQKIGAVAGVQEPGVTGYGINSAQWSDVDSDADDHICHTDFARESERSAKLTLRDVQGNPLSHHGTRHVDLRVGTQGHRANIDFQIADVSGNILSLGKLLKKGCVFSLKGENDSIMYHQSDPTTTVPFFFAQEQRANSCETIRSPCESGCGRWHVIATVTPITVEFAGSPIGWGGVTQAWRNWTSGARRSWCKRENRRRRLTRNVRLEQIWCLIPVNYQARRKKFMSSHTYLHSCGVSSVSKGEVRKILTSGWRQNVRNRRFLSSLSISVASRPLELLLVWPQTREQRAWCCLTWAQDTWRPCRRLERPWRTTWLKVGNGSLSSSSDVEFVRVVTGNPRLRFTMESWRNSSPTQWCWNERRGMKAQQILRNALFERQRNKSRWCGTGTGLLGNSCLWPWLIHHAGWVDARFRMKPMEPRRIKTRMTALSLLNIFRLVTWYSFRIPLPHTQRTNQNRTILRWQWMGQRVSGKHDWTKTMHTSSSLRTVERLHELTADFLRVNVLMFLRWKVWRDCHGMDRAWSVVVDHQNWRRKDPRWQKRVKRFEGVDPPRLERGHLRFDPSRMPWRLVLRQSGCVWQGGDGSAARPQILQLLKWRRGWGAWTRFWTLATTPRWTWRMQKYERRRWWNRQVQTVMSLQRNIGALRTS